jgi:hypothetical protein
MDEDRKTILKYENVGSSYTTQDENELKLFGEYKLNL